MSKFKPQHLRLLFIDQKIRKGDFPNCNSMAKEYEVDRKTIQGDINFMRDQLDAPIEYDKKFKGYRYTEEQYRLPAIPIRESDLFAIYLAEKLLVQYEGTPLFSSLSSVFKKIEQSLGETIKINRVGDQSKFTVFPPFCSTIDPSVWKSMTACLRESRRVDITYKTQGKSPEGRKIEPYHAFNYEGGWYIVGYCHKRESILTFNLSRVIKASETNEKFQTPPDFEFQKLFGSHFGVYWSDKFYAVKILFSREVSEYIKEKKWHPSQEIIDCSNGDVILSMTVNHTLELKRWILSWGNDARVIEPVDFANEIGETIHKMHVRYN